MHKRHKKQKAAMLRPTAELLFKCALNTHRCFSVWKWIDSWLLVFPDPFSFSFPFRCPGLSLSPSYDMLSSSSTLFWCPGCGGVIINKRNPFSIWRSAFVIAFNFQRVRQQQQHRRIGSPEVAVVAVVVACWLSLPLSLPLKLPLSSAVGPRLVSSRGCPLTVLVFHTNHI